MWRGGRGRDHRGKALSINRVNIDVFYREPLKGTYEGRRGVGFPPDEGGKLINEIVRIRKVAEGRTE